MGDTTPSGFRSSHQAARIPLKKNQGLFLLKSLRGSIPPTKVPKGHKDKTLHNPTLDSTLLCILSPSYIWY